MQRSVMEEKPVGQVLNDCATTTHAVRAAIQRSKASVADLFSRAVWGQSKDGSQVAGAQERRGHADGAEEPVLHDPVPIGGSRVRRLSQAHALASG